MKPIQSNPVDQIEGIENTIRRKLLKTETGTVDLDLVFEGPVMFHDSFMVIQK